MTLTRRLAAALPAVGVTALAALAFAGTPAGATTGEGVANAARPAVMMAPCPAGEKCADGYGDGNGAAPDDGRGKPGYGGQSATPTPNKPTKPTTPTKPTGTKPTGNTNTVPPGGESPGTVPPTGYTNTVPPGGESPATVPPTGNTNTVPPGGGVSPGTLALTGAPVVATLSTGAMLLIGGGAAIWYTRRRRTA